MDAVTASRTPGQRSVDDRTKQGELKWLLISGVPIHNLDGDIIGSMGIHYDITERKRDEQRMVRAMLDAEAARQTEREFRKASAMKSDTHDRHPGDDRLLGYVHERGTAPLWKAMLEGGSAQQLLDGVLNRPAWMRAAWKSKSRGCRSTRFRRGDHSVLPAEKESS